MGGGGGMGGGEMSQLCLTGLRAELCGLMLREGGREGVGREKECPPPPTHTQRHTHGWTAGVLVTLSRVTRQPVLTWSRLP